MPRKGIYNKSVKLLMVLSIYIEGSKFLISQTYYISFSGDFFILAKSADPDEMPHDGAFYLGLHCLQICLLGRFWPTKG